LHELGEGEQRRAVGGGLAVGVAQSSGVDDPSGEQRGAVFDVDLYSVAVADDGQDSCIGCDVGELGQRQPDDEGHVGVRLVLRHGHVGCLDRRSGQVVQAGPEVTCQPAASGAVAGVEVEHRPSGHRERAAGPCVALQHQWPGVAAQDADRRVHRCVETAADDDLTPATNAAGVQRALPA
jgi:hypothetical protein